MEKIDGLVEIREVLITDVYGAENPSKVRVVIRNKRQLLTRSLKRSGKIYGLVLCILPIAIFVHILLLLSILAILGATILLFWGLTDGVTFDYVEGICPRCKQLKQMKPFRSPKYILPLSVICTDCGTTFSAKTQDLHSG